MLLSTYFLEGVLDGYENFFYWSCSIQFQFLEYMIPQVSFSLEWFHILLRSKSHGQQRALEMNPRGSAGHGPSLLN